jgi:glycosyltransferase involved in cell wall biosynthesis
MAVMTAMERRHNLRFGCVSTYVPRRCGLATFASDLVGAIARELDDPQACQIVAMNDGLTAYDYPHCVRFEVRQEEPTDYRLAADLINTRGLDLLLLQHEYGIFGGPEGAHVLNLLRDLRMPVVTTCHTVLEEPLDQQQRVLASIVEMSDRLVVMSQRGAELLKEVYAAPSEKVVIIPHGIPDMPFVDPSFHKDQFGVEGRKVMLTFGLLTQYKGIEYAIQALPQIVSQHPDFIYIVLGATHPKIKEEHGEQYRHSLMRLADDLGVAENVAFHDRFVELDELCQYLGAADLYLTPYVTQQQITSGTLAYAMGAGKAVISTLYIYAREMLADGRGMLVGFRDPKSIADAVCWLLSHEVEQQAMRKKAYLYSRQALWSEVARSYHDVFRQVVARPSVPHPYQPSRSLDSAALLRALPEPKFDHLLAMSDDVGILQHAHYSTPNRNHGYSTDDNARALAVALRAYTHVRSSPILRLARTCLSFLHHALDRQTVRFRGYMTHDRRWLEDSGGEESHARALWGLGEAVALAPLDGMRASALDLFDRALPATLEFQSPRAWAYTLLGIDTYLSRYGGDSQARRIRESLAQQLLEFLGTPWSEHGDDWLWPEPELRSVSGVLPHALMLAGRGLGRNDMLEQGQRALRWLLAYEMDDGLLSPTGEESGARRENDNIIFDQRPVETHAMLEGCLAAYQITGQRDWAVATRRCFEWFLGRNVLGKPLYDYQTGGCRDGLHGDHVNQNQGSESTLAWLMSLQAIRALDHAPAQPASGTAPAERSDSRESAPLATS